jgi:predicted dehydrogenase/threonine dehydrogenase-like Zn-dependent dehydrogenase
MRQLLQNMRDGKAVVETVPVPTVRPGTALVRTAASLVSAGTERMVVEFAEKSLVGKARSRPDLTKQVLERARREGLLSTVQSAFSRLDQPMALGYSSAGTIVALGTHMPGFKVGQRVACAGGGYAVHADYAVVPRNLLTLLPKQVDFESGAFATLAAIAMHGFRLAEPQVGERVAVVGLGLLGYLAAQIALAAGCSVFGIDIDPKRVALAASLGIEAVARARAVDAGASFTTNRGFDVVLICADTRSNDPVELAALIARDRARIVATGAVGLNIPRKAYYEKELSFINSRSYGPGRYDAAYEEAGKDYPLGYVRWTEGRNLESVVELMAHGKLKVAPLITHRFPIEMAAQAYGIITGRKTEAFLGVLLTYDHGQETSTEGVELPGVKSRASHAEGQSSERNGPVANIRLGVIGAGNFANATLLPAIKKVPGLELVGIASSGGLHAQHTGKKFGFAYATSVAEDVIADAKINTVAILTRHDTHADLVVKALKAGKNVFVEKPLAITGDQLSVISKQLAKGGHGLLTVGFNRRFAPLAQQLLAFYHGRTEPMHVHYRINAGSIPSNHWTQDLASGGRVIGEACHFVDFVTFLVGAAPCSVSAQALPDNGKYQEDNVSMTFTFPDGSIGVVDYLANGDRSVAKERVEVFCGGRVAMLDDFRALETVHAGKRKVVRAPQNKGWTLEWMAFASAITAGGEPPIPYEQLIGVTKATFAAMEAVHTKKPQEI